jgi:hypothetical protein
MEFSLPLNYKIDQKYHQIKFDNRVKKKQSLEFFGMKNHPTFKILTPFGIKAELEVTINLI